MSSQARLRITGPDIDSWYPLDPAKGTTSIGRGRDNDIILDDPEVASAHAYITHAQKPFQIIRLSQEGAVIVRERLIAPREPTPLEYKDRIRIGEYLIILVAPSESADAVPHEFEDGEYAIALSPPEWAVDAGETVTYQVKITNEGPRVTQWHAELERIDQSWYTLSDAQGVFKEWEGSTITLEVTPPRLPASRAGSHSFSIIVTSPNYPRDSQASATLIIYPYYDFTLDGPSPRDPSIPRDQDFEWTDFSITNRGNTETDYHIAAEDNRGACSFEFRSPNGEDSLVSQLEFSLPPGETLPIRMRITRPNLQSDHAESYEYWLSVTDSGGNKKRIPLGVVKVESRTAAEDMPPPEAEPPPAPEIPPPEPDFVPQPPASPPPAGGTDKKRTWIIVAVVAVVLLLCCCCIAAIVGFLFTEPGQNLLHELSMQTVPSLVALF